MLCQHQSKTLPHVETLLCYLRTFCMDKCSGTTDYARNTGKFLVIQMGKHTLAIPQDQVREIYVPLRIKPINCTLPQVLGIVDIRGEQIPVINLFHYLGGGVPDLPWRPKLLITRNTSCTVALAAEKLGKVMEVKKEDIEPAEPSSFASLLINQDTGHIPVPDIEAVVEECRSKTSGRPPEGL